MSNRNIGIMEVLGAVVVLSSIGLTAAVIFGALAGVCASVFHIVFSWLGV